MDDEEKCPRTSAGQHIQITSNQNGVSLETQPGIAPIGCKIAVAALTKTKIKLIKKRQKKKQHAL